MSEGLRRGSVFGKRISHGGQPSMGELRAEATEGGGDAETLRGEG